MNLFESERKVMDVLWREGSITAGKIAKILTKPTILPPILHTFTMQSHCYILSQKKSLINLPASTPDKIASL